MEQNPEQSPTDAGGGGDVLVMQNKPSSTSLQFFHASGQNGHVLTSNQQEWTPVRGMLVHAGLLAKGILVIKSVNLNTPNITSHSFLLGSKMYIVHEPGENKGSKRRANKIVRAHKLLSKIGLATKTHFVSGTTQEKATKEMAILDPKSRDTVFMSVVVRKQKLGFYVSPWLSHNNTTLDKLNLSKFDRFSAVGCMLGQALTGSTIWRNGDTKRTGNTRSIIDHHIKWLPKEQIVSIECSHSSSSWAPYEEANFQEFEHLILLMQQVANPETKCKLYYHLPYADYILFGAALFINNRITLSALSTLFEEIILKKIAYSKRLHNICQSSSLELIIQSPFDNLFDRKIEDYLKGDVATNIFKQIVGDSYSPQELQKNGEKHFVNLCISNLRKNKFNPKHRIQWQQSLVGNTLPKATKGSQKKPMEDLFSIANALMINVAASGQKSPYATLSILPASERPIQEKHKNTSSPGKEKVVYLNTLEVACYTQTSNAETRKGSLFYSTNPNLDAVLKQKDLLQLAHYGVVNFGRPPVPNNTKPQPDVNAQRRFKK